MTGARSRAYKLQMSADGITMFLRCHHRLCCAAGDMLPYGTTLFVAVSLLHQSPLQQMTEALFDPALKPLGGRTIRFVGTSPVLSAMVADILDRVAEQDTVYPLPRVWMIFLAALAFMDDVSDHTIRICLGAAMGQADR